MAGKTCSTMSQTGQGSSAYMNTALQLPPIYPGTRLHRAFAEGRLAAKNGDSVASGPHGFGTLEATAWVGGWYTWDFETPASDPEWGSIKAEMDTGLSLEGAVFPFFDYSNAKFYNTGAPALNDVTFSQMTSPILMVDNNIFVDAEGFPNLIATINKVSGGYKSYSYFDGIYYHVCCWSTIDNEWCFLFDNSNPETWSDNDSKAYNPNTDRDPSFLNTFGIDGDGDYVPDPNSANVAYV